MIDKAKIGILKFARKGLRRYSINQLKKNERLWQELNIYRNKTKSTGCSWIDLWTLYNTIRIKKPGEILELGPGLSTLVMSYALMENQKEGSPGRITAMEELEEYMDMATALQPDHLKPFVNFYLSPKVEDHLYIFRGVRYRDVPDKPYDFVFVDGPDLYAPSDGQMTFDFDFINVVKRSEKPVYGIVDYRLTTSFVFQTIFGKDKVKFDAIRELEFIGPVTKNDLLHLDLDKLTSMLLKNFKLLGNTRVRIAS